MIEKIEEYVLFNTLILSDVWLHKRLKDCTYIYLEIIGIQHIIHSFQFAVSCSSFPIMFHEVEVILPGIPKQVASMFDIISPVTQFPQQGLMALKNS